MIPKSGNRFSGKIMLQYNPLAAVSFLSLRLRGFQRHARFILGAAKRQRRPDAAHVGRGGEFGEESLKCREVGGDALQNEIDLARQHPALAHQGPFADGFVEGGEISLRLAREVHHDEYGDLVAEAFFVEQRPIAADDARVLKGAHSPQAWRRGDTDAAGKLYVGDAPVAL